MLGFIPIGVVRGFKMAQGRPSRQGNFNFFFRGAEPAKLMWNTHAQEGGEHGRATAGLCGQTWRAQLMGKREAGAWCKTSLSKSV